MNRCRICGHQTGECESFCAKHAKFIDHAYGTTNSNLVIEAFILYKISNEQSDIHIIRRDNLMAPTEQKELTARENFLRYSKIRTQAELNEKSRQKLESIFRGASADIRFHNDIYITQPNGRWDYESFDELEKYGFMFQDISYKTRWLSRNVNCVVCVRFDPDYPKSWKEWGDK